MSSDNGFLYSDEDEFDNLSVSDRSDRASVRLDRVDDFDMYDEFNKLELCEAACESTTIIAALSGPHIYALNPYEIVKLVEHDSKIEREFFSNINSLHSLLLLCDKAIETFHMVNGRPSGLPAATPTNNLQVVLYSNQNQNINAKQNKQEDKNKEIIDNFFCLKRVRFVISHCIIHIRKLSEDILTAVERLESSRGADSAIVIESIQQALINFEGCADQVEKLDITLRDIFQSDHLTNLRKHLGWSTADKVLADTLEEIDSLEKKQRDVHVAIKCQQGKLINYNNLISATQRLFPRSYSNVEAKEERARVHGHTIATVKRTIGENSASASSFKYLQWFYWWTSKVNCEKVKNANLNGNEETQYYDSLIFVRARGKVESMLCFQNDQKKKEITLQDLQELYIVYNSEYLKTVKELVNMNEAFKLKMTNFQLQIGGLKNKSHKSYWEPNCTLLRSVTSIETFIKLAENKDAPSALQPLFAILSGIKTLVKSDIQLLSSYDRSDIFVAGKRLKKQSAFLLNYAEAMIYL